MSSNKIAVIIVLLGVFAASYIVFGGKSVAPVLKNNVTVANGKQIIEIAAKNGYSPERSVASAGVPTVLRFTTAGTFDCSLSVRIPSKNISKVLPREGATDIDVGTPERGTLYGSCGMGMYPFSVTFE